MATENPFPLSIGTKSDSWEKLQLLANIDPEYKYTAYEWNEIKQALDYLYENILESVPSTTPAYEIIEFPDDLLFTSAGATTTNEEIEALINTQTFEIKAGILAVIHIPLIREINGKPTWVREQYRFMPNNVIGVYGTGEANGEVALVQFSLISTFVMYIPPANAEIIDLGDIGTDTIEDYLNALDGGTVAWEDLLDNGTDYFFRCIISGDAKFYKYVGTLPVTLGTDVVTDTDFDLQDYNNTSEVTVLPTEHQIKGKVQEKLTATGAVTLDTDDYSDFYINQTGAATFTIPVPTMENGDSTRRFFKIKPNSFTPTLPTVIVDNMVGAFDDLSLDYWLVITFMKLQSGSIDYSANLSAL